MPSHSRSGFDNSPGPNEPERCCCPCYECTCDLGQLSSDPNSEDSDDQEWNRTPEDFYMPAHNEPEVEGNASFGLLALNAWSAQLHSIRRRDVFREATTWMEGLQVEMETQRLDDLSQPSSMEVSFTSAQWDSDQDHLQQATSMAVDVDLDRSFYANSSSSSSCDIALLVSDPTIVQGMGGQFEISYFINKPLPLADPDSSLRPTALPQ